MEQFPGDPAVDYHQAEYDDIRAEDERNLEKTENDDDYDKN